MERIDRMTSDRYERLMTPFPCPSPLRNCLVLLAIFAFSNTSSLPAEDNWPQFRGPGARGISDSKALPIVWGPDTNVAWRTAIPGLGWSSPIVWDQRVFLTTAVSEGEVETPKKGLYLGGDRPEPLGQRHHWQVVCLDLESGKVLWTTEVAAAAPSTPRHVKNTYASETPVTDGERVYALFGSVGLFCLDFDGKILWSHPIQPRKMANGWGTAASPVLHGDRVFIVCDNEEESFAAAFDKRTGRELWRVPRDEPSNWSTPFIWEHGTGPELVTTGRKKVRSYDLSGEPIWELKGLSSITIPTPFAAEGLLYLAGGYVGDQLAPNKPVYAVRPGGRGDLTPPSGEKRSEFIAWMEPNAAPYNPSPLVYEGRFYVLWDFGFLSCCDAASGRELYDKQRLKPGGSASFTASPWAYRGRVFCLSEDGDTYVCQAGDNYRQERVNSLGEMCMATPALVRDSLVLRSIAAVYRIREER